ncbi:MAG: phage head closure protein [Proteobacteria bacterium]|nr:phage head closure protein [Pseudomonadota bacterium]
MPIGEMNRRIVIQYPTRIGDGMGGFTSTWVTAATVWAKAWTVSSSEQTTAMQTSLIRVQKFKIRYRSVLLPSWRIKWGTRYFNITGIDPDEKNEFIFLTVKEAA